MKFSLLCILLIGVSGSVFAQGNINVYNGLTYNNTSDCTTALAIAANKIQQSGYGAADSIEGYCDGLFNETVHISFVTDIAPKVVSSHIYQTQSVDAQSQTGKTDPSDRNQFMADIVAQFETPTFLILEVGDLRESNDNQYFYPAVRVLDTVGGSEPWLYFGTDYSLLDCTTKLGQIVTALKVKFGKAVGRCYANGQSFKPVVFYVPK